MQKRKKVKHLHREKSHRESLLRNLLTDLFRYERVTSTIPKLKVTAQLAEKIITRAIGNLQSNISSEKKLHNIRLVERRVKDKAVLNKVFNDIAVRSKDRKGGYTRLIKIGRFVRTDNSDIALLELVDKKDVESSPENKKEGK